MCFNYNVLKELMKIYLLSASNLAGGIGKEIQGVESISSVTVMVSYISSESFLAFSWCFRPCPTAQQCIFDLNDTISLSEMRHALESERTLYVLWLSLEQGRSSYQTLDSVFKLCVRQTRISLGPFNFSLSVHTFSKVVIPG